MSRLLALDVGDERIGVAVGDETGTLARPLTTIRRVSGAQSYQKLAELIQLHDVSAIVVGLPLLPEGDRGKQVRSTEAYVRGLKMHISLPVCYWDERDSTRHARQIQHRTGDRRHSVDAVAAAVILQTYLDEGACDQGD